MTNNIDFAITNVLSNVANIVFNSLTISGDYTGTASEIAKHFSKSVSIYFSIEYMEKKQLTKAQKAEYNKLSPALPRHQAVKVDDQNGDDFEIKNNMVSVTVDTFHASFHCYDVFRFLAKFEAIAGVKSSQRSHFTHSAKKEEGDEITVTIPAAAKEILKNVSKNPDKKALNGIYFDAKKSTFVATDGYTLAVIPVTMSAHLPEFDGITIPTAVAQAALKNREMSVTICRQEIRVNGITCESLRFPRYTSVFPYFKEEDDQRIIFAKKAWSELLKQIKKEEKNTRIYFRARSGEMSVTVYVRAEFDETIKNTFVLPLAAPAVASFAKIFTAENISRFKDVESFRGLESFRPSILEGGGLVSLIMPCQWTEIEGVTDSWHQYQDSSTSNRDCNYCPLNAVFAPAEEVAEPEQIVTAEPVAEDEQIVTAEPMAEDEQIVTAEPMAEDEQIVTAEPMAEDEQIVTAEPMAEGEQAVTAEPMAEGEQIVTAEPMAEDQSETKYAFFASFLTTAAAVLLAIFILSIKPDPAAQAAPVAALSILAEDEQAVTAEPVAEGEQIVTAEPMAEDEQAVTAEPMAEGEQIVTAEPMAEDEQIVTAEPVAEDEQVVTAEPMAEDEQIVTAEPMAEDEQIVTAEPMAEDEQIVTAEPVAEDEQIVTAEPMAEGEQIVTAEPMAEDDTMEAATALYAPIYNILTAEIMPL